MLWNCHFTKNERYHKSFFNAFDRKCAITTSYHIFLQNNNFCRAPLESCFCVCKIWKNYQDDKKCSMLPINNCAKKLHFRGNNFPKCQQKLSGTTTCKKTYQQLFLLLLLVHQSFKAIFV